MKNLMISYLKKVFYKRKVIKYLKCEKNAEERKILKHLKKKPFLVFFPYDFTKKYKSKDIKIFNKDGAKYINYFGKKLFIKNSFNKITASNYCKSLYVEQDTNSPHKYVDEKFYVEKETVLFDVGSAEGNFTLENIDKCKKIYLFEPEKKWVQCLEKTFKDYNDKVVVIQKFVTNKTSDSTIKLDDFVKEIDENDKVFIKMDIEGYEIEALEGMKNLTSQCKNLKMAICCYHNQSDEAKIREKFPISNYNIDTSEGYMIYYPSKEFTEPYLTRGVLRIIKKSKKHK